MTSCKAMKEKLFGSNLIAKLNDSKSRTALEKLFMRQKLSKLTARVGGTRC